MERFSWTTSPFRIVKHAFRFRLRSVFVAVAICACVLAYHMYHYEETCYVLIAVHEPGAGLVCFRTVSVCQPLLAFNDDEAFFEDVLEEPGVGQLSVIQGQADPKTWLMTRLQLEIIHTGHLMTVTLRYYPCRDKGRIEELPVILNAVIQVMKRYAEPKFSITVVQMPTVRKSTLGSFHQYYGAGK